MRILSQTKEAIQQREWRARNRESYNASARKRFAENRENILARARELNKLPNRKASVAEYRKSNHEKILELGRNWRKKNAKAHCERSKRYYAANKDAINARRKGKPVTEKARQYFRARDQKSAALKDNRYVKKLIARRMVLALDGTVKKSASTESLLGCSIEQLRTHLESLFRPGMSWDNHGVDGWHIDHIIPCCAFDLSNVEHQKKCFHFTNLQPLWESENCSKATSDKQSILAKS